MNIVQIIEHLRSSAKMADEHADTIEDAVSRADSTIARADNILREAIEKHDLIFNAGVELGRSEGAYAREGYAAGYQDAKARFDTENDSYKMGFNTGYDDGYLDGVADARTSPEDADARVAYLCDTDEYVDDATFYADDDYAPLDDEAHEAWLNGNDGA